MIARRVLQECGPADAAPLAEKLIADARIRNSYLFRVVTPGVGARTVQALALVSEVVHGARCRFSDPARFSFAHGGKDRHPFPVPLKVYDETIRVLKQAVQQARLGATDELAAIKRLDAEARRLERVATGPGVPELIADERRRSHEYGGRSVFGWEPPPEPLRRSG